jgi:hypothetical protein
MNMSDNHVLQFIHKAVRPMYDYHACNITHFLNYAYYFTFNCTNKYTLKRSEAILQQEQRILTSKTWF